MSDPGLRNSTTLDEERIAGLVVTVRRSVATVTIDRQDRRNALDQATMEALTHTFDRFDADPDVRVVVLTGAGERAFSSGRDLKERSEVDRGGQRAIPPMRGTHRNCFETVWECRKPTICAINGDAVGGGMEIAMACDLRVAADHARFGLPESKRGMGANFGSNVLARAIPPGVYYEWLYFGDLFPVTEALKWGVVNQVVPAEELTETVDAWCEQLVTRAPLSMARYKATMQRGRDLSLSAALRANFSPDPYASEDRLEGIAAFVEKRQPRWKGR